MKRALLHYLTCPRDGESLELDVLDESSAEIKTGRLSCASGHVYPIERYIPRFVETAGYAQTFSAQREYVRRHFRSYQKDRSGDELFYATTGWSREALLRGPCLEIGCGYGRFVDVVEREGAEIIGVDLSTQSIELAHSFVGMRPRVHLIQADLFQLPLKREMFGSVYSIGALHHTPDCKAAFESLPPYLADGGQIAIWVYHPSNQNNVVAWRRRTTKWSSTRLYAWCIFNQTAFGWIRRLPWLRWRFNAFVPGAVPRRSQSFWLRVMEDFDNLSPKYASSHSEDEVLGWFKQAGLANIQRLARRTSVAGCRSTEPTFDGAHRECARSASPAGSGPPSDTADLVL